MKYQNLIFDSLKESFNLIYKNKSLFALLFILQVIFFVIFSLISYRYVPKMIESQSAIEDYVSQLKLDEASVTSNILQQKNIFGDDPLSISRNFQNMVRNFRVYLISIFMLLVTSIPVNWTITIRMINKKKI